MKPNFFRAENYEFICNTNEYELLEELRDVFKRYDLELSPYTKTYFKGCSYSEIAEEIEERMNILDREIERIA